MSVAPDAEEARVLPVVFFDGDCGLCHRTVRFLIARDPEGALFRFAPLDGETLAARIPAERRATLPDSVVVLEPDGELHIRSAAMISLLELLGGRFARRARWLRRLPRPLLDFGYDLLAAVRHRIWSRPPQACPVASPELRARFDP